MTTSVKELQATIDRMKTGDAPTAEVRRLLSHASPLIRVNALRALVDPARRNAGLTEELIAAASAPVNKVSLMGTISVAHVAVECLLRIGTKRAIDAAQALLKEWPEPDRTDLVWYLNSVGLTNESRHLYDHPSEAEIGVVS